MRARLYAIDVRRDRHPASGASAKNPEGFNNSTLAVEAEDDTSLKLRPPYEAVDGAPYRSRFYRPFPFFTWSPP